MQQPPEIECLASTEVYRNRWMRVREDRIRRQDGSEGIYGIVEKPDFAVIAAIDGDQLWLVEQYRYPLGGRYWELPQGSWEQDGMDPLELAKAELREETGLIAQQMTHAARLYLAPGYSNQAYNLYLATDLTQGHRALDLEEQGLIARPFKLDDVLQMILDGQIVDATTVACLGVLRLRGVG